MKILHVTAECYPVAKAGGLGDVAGALPKYQQQLGHEVKLVMPMYRTPFLYQNDFKVVHKGKFDFATGFLDYTIIHEVSNQLGFGLYLVDINGLLDREAIYGYDDDAARFTAFQIAVLNWVSSWEYHPDVVHVHDYHAGLIPFLMQECFQFQPLRHIPTVLTIHNAQYQGWMNWDHVKYLPDWNRNNWGKLDWNNSVNPLASAVKCAHKVTTVSHSYLQELRHHSNGLEDLFEYEKGKCVGILNGIDTAIWNPLEDMYLDHHYDNSNVSKGKNENKLSLCNDFNLDPARPLFVFIGRLVHEKAADLLPQAIYDAVFHLEGKMNFLILGSGEPHVEWQLSNLTVPLAGYYNSRIGYNEKLSHRMYAGADFLLMPSRIEPCGLNQMYALRYGTIPLVRNTGGLRDTVIDMGEPDGFGIVFNEPKVWDITYSIYRALELYQQKDKLEKIRKKIMNIDHSWENSAEQYLNLYRSLQ